MLRLLSWTSLPLWPHLNVYTTIKVNKDFAKNEGAKLHDKPIARYADR